MVIKIKIEDVVLLIKTIEDLNFDCPGLLHFLGGEIEEQKVNNSTLKLIVTKSKINAMIVIDSTNALINGIALYGKFEITPIDLLTYFETYRESYSFRDELYFYYFNENKFKGNYKLYYCDANRFNGSNETSHNDVENIIISWS